MSIIKPDGFVLLQDPAFDGDLLTGTHGGTPALPSEAGPQAGPAAPSTSNNGSLFPFCFGKWDESVGTAQPNPTALQHRVVAAGGLFGNAEWAWKYDTDASDQWRGMNDMRAFTRAHNPFTDLASTYNGRTHLCSIYSRVSGKMLLFRFNGSSFGNEKFEVAKRSVSNDDPSAWSVSDWPTATGFAGYKDFVTTRLPTIKVPYCCGWENSDGSLRFLYPYNPIDAETIDHLTFDIWGSSDGGETWDVLVEDVCTKYMGGYRKIAFINADSSGDWARISMYVTDLSPNGLLTLVTSDGGSSWKLISTTASLVDAKSSDNYQPYECSAIVGTGTSDGAFVRIAKGLATGTTWQWATRDNDWQTIPNTSSINFQYATTGGTVKAVYAGRGSTYIHVLILVSQDDSSSEEVCGWDGNLSYLIPLNAITDPRMIDGTGSWLSTGSATDGTPALGIVKSGFMNQYYTAYRPKLASNSFRWAGDRMILFQSSMAHKSTATNKDILQGLGGLTASYRMGYSRRPLRSRLWSGVEDTSNDYWIPYNTIAGSAFAAHEISNQWRTEWGAPNAINTISTTDWTSANSFWSIYANNIASSSNSWNSEEFTMASGSGALDFFYLDRSYVVTPSPPTGYAMGDRSIFAFTMKVDSGSIGTLPSASSSYDNPAIGLFVGGVNTLGTAGTFQVSVALTTQEVAVYDCGAGTTLYHATGKDFTKWKSFRLALGHSKFVGDTGNNVYADFGYGALDGSGWTNSGLLTVDNTTLSSTNQYLQIGMGLGGTGAIGSGNSSGRGNTIYLKDIIVARGVDLSNLDFENPWSLRGVPATPYQRHTAQGIYTSWGGGAGFKGDEFEMDVQYSYGIDQINTASPQSCWRSTSLATQYMTFDAASSDDYQRFQHSGVAFVGSNSRLHRVDWDDNSAFTSPTGITVDSTLYSVDVSIAISANSDGIIVGTSAHPYKDHELIGMYAEWDDGSGTRKQTFEIRENIGRNIFFTGLTQTLSSYGISAGHTFHVYGNQSIGLIDSTTIRNNRFMRVTVPQSTPVDSYYKIGRMIAGTTLQLSVPMDWDYVEAEQGNVDLVTNLNGTRFAYKAGEPRKTITGTIVGDIDRTRVEYRAAISKLAQYSTKPLILCQDDLKPTAQMIYARYVDNTDFANAGWKYDSSLGRWTRVGDMQVTFEEEL